MSETTRKQPAKSKFQQVLEEKLENMTEEELVVKLGIDKRTLQRWRDGTSRPRKDIWPKLRDFFGKSFKELGLIDTADETADDTTIQEPIVNPEEDHVVPSTGQAPSPEMEEDEEPELPQIITENENLQTVSSEEETSENWQSNSVSQADGEKPQEVPTVQEQNELGRESGTEGEQAHSSQRASTPTPIYKRRDFFKIAVGTAIGLGIGIEIGTTIWYVLTHQLPLPPNSTGRQPTPTPPAFGTWTPTGSLAVPRVYHSATHLQDDTVLVAAGRQSLTVLIPFSEVYNPTEGTWQRKGDLITPRLTLSNSLFTLKTGEALLIGGMDDTQILGLHDDYSACELYNPHTGEWTATGGLNTPRRGATITLLADGKVLATAGAYGLPDSNQFIASAEIYDPKTGVWGYAGNLKVARQNANSVLLRDGKVMVAGGEGPESVFGNIVEIFNPNIRTWSQTASMTWGWSNATLTLLQAPDERVLLAGGSTTSGAYANAALYDPAKKTWQEIRPMSIKRAGHTASLLPNGHVLIVGGTDKTDTQIYDPQRNIWYAGPSLKEARGGHIAITLNDGDILIIGGVGNSGNPLASCERLQISS